MSFRKIVLIVLGMALVLFLSYISIKVRYA